MTALVRAAPFAVVEKATRLPFPPDIVYQWHARPGAFERLVPPWESVERLERTGGLEDGARTVLRARLGPFPIRWEAVHRDHVAGRQFVDEQVVGPFAHWIHTHRFDPSDDGGCLLTDRVEYAPPYGLLGAAAGLWLVRRRVERLLAYRHAIVAADLARHARFSGQGPLRIAMTGAGGLLGRALTAMLSSGGHTVLPMVRRAPGPGEIGWDPAAGRIDARRLDEVDAVVHLAGENLASGRWTRARRRRIRESRVGGTRLLATTLASLERKPRVLVSASAVGIYGSRGDEALDDRSAPAREGGFLADVTREWEAAAEPARQAGIRVAQPRFGAVLTPAGGALAKMLPAFRAGVAGKLGDGRQWLSWISLEDAIGAAHHALLTGGLDGPFNAVAPTPVTNADFTEILGRVLGRPTLAPLPAGLLRVLFGAMAEETILASTRVLPDLLPASGFAFQHPDVETALRFELGRR